MTFEEWLKGIATEQEYQRRKIAVSPTFEEWLRDRTEHEYRRRFDAAVVTLKELALRAHHIPRGHHLRIRKSVVDQVPRVKPGPMFQGAINTFGGVPVVYDETVPEDEWRLCSDDNPENVTMRGKV